MLSINFKEKTASYHWRGSFLPCPLLCRFSDFATLSLCHFSLHDRHEAGGKVVHDGNDIDGGGENDDYFFHDMPPGDEPDFPTRLRFPFPAI